MAEMAVLVDTSRCTGCRGCQVACKQWNKNPATETCFTGSYENPPKLEPNTFTRVTFREVEEDGKLLWLFRKDQCRHCVDPACKGVCSVEGAIVKRDNGAVVVDQEKCTGECDFECADACPYGIPCFMPEAPKSMKKCTFCVDRQEMGKKPACVTACLSGTLFFGTRSEVIAEGKKRVAALKAKFPKAELLDAEDVSCIYLLTQETKKYGMHIDRSKMKRTANV